METIRNRIFILLVIVFMIYPGCYPLPDRPPKMKDGKEYGDTEGLFRHRWWNYYERGLSFADGEFWQDAESDLREAIRQRDSDKRRARTYGLHFIDYFPHRELGIVLFMQGRIEEAEKELELSYYTVKSAKAALYLDRVRKSLIEKKQLAHVAPEITVEPPKQDPEKPFFATIKGIAQNDAFVRHITIITRDKQEVRVDVSDKHIDFQSEVRLVPGDNPIRIKAENLMGDSSETSIIVYADNTGPVISFDKFYDGQIPENSICLSDDSGLAEISLKGQKPIKLNGKKFRFPEKTLSFPATEEVLIEAKDVAGNITTTTLYFSNTLSKLLADNSILPRGILIAPNRNESSFIDLRHPSEEERLTYRDYVSIEGEISGIKELSIRDQKWAYDPKGKSNFSKKILLPDKGKNEIIINGLTISGESVSQKLEINRKSLSDIRPPLKLAINDFTRTPENIREYMTHDLENSLMSVIKQHGRFTVGVYDKKMENNDCILDGLITERADTIEVSFYLKDIEATDEPLIIKDIYRENIRGALSEELAKKISEKMIVELPLTEGKFLSEQAGIIKNNNNQIAINIGTEAKLKKGMKIMIYDIMIRKEGGRIQDLTYPLGQATIKVVNDGASWIYLDKDLKYEAIKAYHSFVTR